MENRAKVHTHIEYPDHTNGVLSLTEIQPGVFEAVMVANMAGIYRFTTEATGVTHKDSVFQRTDSECGRVPWYPRYSQPAIGGISKGDLCRLFNCLLDGKSLSKEVRGFAEKAGHRSGWRGRVLQKLARSLYG
jgi:hypothetical protein